MCLYLPRYMGEPTDDEQHISAEIAELGPGETVLIIDDEPTVRVLIVNVLEEARLFSSRG
jgi:hypothetical protein